MKNKTYKIVNTLTLAGELSDSAKHRIGRTGKIVRLTKGMGFRFLYDATGLMLNTSVVEDIEISRDIIRIETLNTVYMLQEV